MLFSDDSLVATGRRHFFSYSYGPPFASTAATGGDAHTRGDHDRVDGRRAAAAYPEVVVTPGDEIFAPNFHVNDNLNGFLTGDTDADTVESIIGGVGCGE